MTTSELRREKKEEGADYIKPLTPAQVTQARRKGKEGEKKAEEPRGMETREGKGSQTKQRDKENT